MRLLRLDRQHVQCSIAINCSSTPHENACSVHTGCVFSRTLVFLTKLRVLRHAHALFVEPLLGAHITETVAANSIKSKLL